MSRLFGRPVCLICPRNCHRRTQRQLNPFTWRSWGPGGGGWLSLARRQPGPPGHLPEHAGSQLQCPGERRGRRSTRRRLLRVPAGSTCLAWSTTKLKLPGACCLLDRPYTDRLAVPPHGSRKTWMRAQWWASSRRVRHCVPRCADADDVLVLGMNRNDRNEQQLLRAVRSPLLPDHALSAPCLMRVAVQAAAPGRLPTFTPSPAAGRCL